LRSYSEKQLCSQGCHSPKNKTTRKLKKDSKKPEKNQTPFVEKFTQKFAKTTRKLQKQPDFSRFNQTTFNFQLLEKRRDEQKKVISYFFRRFCCFLRRIVEKNQIFLKTTRQQ